MEWKRVPDNYASKSIRTTATKAQYRVVMIEKRSRKEKRIDKHGAH